MRHVLSVGAVVLFAVGACRDRSELPALDSELEADGFRRTSLVSTVAWVDSGIIVLRVGAAHSPSGDVIHTGCAGTALYMVTSSGIIKEIAGTDRLCPRLLAAPTISMMAESRHLLYADQFDSGRIYSVDLQRRVWKSLISGECLLSYASPAWSPAGDRIAYSEGCGRHTAFLHIATKNGTGGRPVGRGTPGMIEDDPSWSPDGTRVVIARRDSIRHHYHELVVVNVATGERRVIATAGDQPAWGKEWIAYLHEDTLTGSRTVRLVRPDGSADHQLPNWSAQKLPPGFVKGPLLWSPDGSAIAFSVGRRIWVADIAGRKSAALADFSQWR